MFLKNKNIIFKIRRSKVTDYAALKGDGILFTVLMIGKYQFQYKRRTMKVKYILSPSASVHVDQHHTCKQIDRLKIFTVFESIRHMRRLSRVLYFYGICRIIPNSTVQVLAFILLITVFYFRTAQGVSITDK